MFLVNEKHAKSVQEFLSVCERIRKGGGRWIFRGQASAQWNLKTKFERSIGPFVKVNNQLELEDVMLREFKRHYHRYSPDVPNEDDRLEWLALMQHHGAPTRLLDWTFSEYVALFFAVRDTIPSEDSIAIWALDQSQCWNYLIKSLRTMRRKRILHGLDRRGDKDIPSINALLTKPVGKIVAPLNPMRLSDRLFAQQGTFLVPLDSAASFQENFQSSVASLVQNSAVKITIPCTEANLLNAFTVLQRVNLTDRNMFPGTDGLARSLTFSALLKHLHPQGILQGSAR